MGTTGAGILAEDVDDAQNGIPAVVSTFKPLNFDEVCLPLVIYVGDEDPSSPKEGFEFGIHIMSLQKSVYDLSGYISFLLLFVHFAITLAGILIEAFQSTLLFWGKWVYKR